jgi:hypothetical protein
MAETTFAISNMSQTVGISVKDISASNDHLFIYLHIPVSFTFRALNDDVAFDVLAIHGKLMYSNPAQLLSEAVLPYATSVQTRESIRGGSIKFTLSRNAFHFIEKNRKGNMALYLELILTTAVKSSISQFTGKRTYVTDYIQNETVQVNFEVPRSDWAEKILKQSGFRNLTMIEIPLSHDKLLEAYDDIIFEFKKAEEYFNTQDYNKCVAHCHNTLDGLTRNLTKIKKNLPSETGFKWLETIDQETLSWIDKLDQRTSALASKSHHSGHKTDFVRPEAESIYLVTLGLLNYVGHIVK